MGSYKLANKIKNYKKVFIFILNLKEPKQRSKKLKKIRVDGSIIRYLTVKYKNLDIENEYFNKNKEFK